MKSTRTLVGAFAGLTLALTASAQVGPHPIGQGYHAHKWVRVTVTNINQLQTVAALSEETLNCAGDGIGTFDVRMTPEKFEAFLRTGIAHNVLMDDIQAVVEANFAEIERRRAAPQDFPSWYDNFKTYTEIVEHVQDLADQNPALATYIPIGQSLQGRTMFALRVTGPGATAERPGIIYTGTQHAREWASPMAVLYIAEHLITEYATNTQVKSLVDNIEFLIVPVVNPDGYDFTWAHPNNRLWRKNMRPAPPSAPNCPGVDPNRNWGFAWGGNQGSSPLPCSETYRGPNAFSEPETQVVRDFVIAHPRITSSIDFHSFSQLVMSPWGYTIALPPDHALFQQISAQMSQAILDTHGRIYEFGPGYTTIYPTTGSVKDWMYGSRGILGWTIEVRDTGSYGFVMPPQEIIPNAEENYAAAKAHALAIGPKLVFSLPSGTPLHVTAGQTNPVQVEIESGVQTLIPASARLFYRIGPAGSLSNVVMTNLGNNLFEADLPAANCGEEIQFVFQAVTTQGVSVKYPAEAFADPFKTTALERVIAFEDNFETNKFWTIGGQGASATAGIWIRQDPQGTLAQPEDDHTPGTTPHLCFITDHRAGVNVAQYDVDGGSTILTSPIMSAISPSPLANAEVWLTYWRWYSNNQGLNPNADSLLIQISNNGGFTWETLEETGENAGVWVKKEFKISDVLPPSPQMQVRLIASDLGLDSVVEAGLDDLQLRIVGCPGTNPCYADCNGSGTLTIADFSCFQAAFAGADPYADCNESGTLTIADFGCFQSKFAEGCP